MKIKNNKREWLLFVSAILLASLIVILFQTTRKSAITASTLVPHRAIYDIKLKSLRGSTQMTNLGGQISFEWTQDCQAVVNNHLFKMRYDYADSPPITVESRFSNYESLDGTTMDFNLQRKHNGDLIEHRRGHADRRKGYVTYSIPADVTHPLSRKVQFPAYHTRLLLKAMQRGKTFYHADLFDGSDHNGSVAVNAFIGKPAPPHSMPENSMIKTALLDTPARHIRLAFFPPGKHQEHADYEMSLIFHENGVMRDIIIEYDDFSMTQNLVALEPLDNICQQEEG